MSTKKTKIGVTLFFIFLFFVYGITLRGKTGNIYPDLKKIDIEHPPFESSLERGRYAQTVSLARRQSFNVDPYPDFVKPDLGWYGGHFYPAFPPGVSVLALPGYLLGSTLNIGQVLSYATTALFSFLTSLVIFRIVRNLGLSAHAGVFAVIAFALSSTAFAYSVTLSAHPVSAFIIAASFLISISIPKATHRSLLFLLLWFIYSLNIFIDYPNLFILLPLLIFSIWNVLRVEKTKQKMSIHFPFYTLYTIVAVLPCLILFILYSQQHYKKPFAFTNTYNLRAVEILGGKVSYINLSNSMFNKKRSYSARFENITHLQDGASTLLISLDRGLFIFSPIFIFSVIGLYILYKKGRPHWLIITGVFLVNLIIYASFDDPWGGWSFGPRYLIPTLPLLAVVAAVGFEEFGGSMLGKINLTILSFYSIAVSLLGAVTTNRVPPGIEASAFHVPSNFLLNLQYIQNKSSSFFYNSVLGGSISPFYFYLSLLSLITIVVLVVIWTNKVKSPSI